MTKVVNLNKARKAKTRADRKVRANANAVKFGRSKAQKAQDKAETLGVVKTLDGAKRDDR